jgi:hypothetical protein
VIAVGAGFLCSFQQNDARASSPARPYRNAIALSIEANREPVRCPFPYLRSCTAEKVIAPSKLGLSCVRFDTGWLASATWLHERAESSLRVLAVPYYGKAEAPKYALFTPHNVLLVD